MGAVYSYFFEEASTGMARLHYKAREATYPGGPKRFPVADELVLWSVTYADYNPTEYTAPVVAKNPPWADPPGNFESMSFNAMDKKYKVDRTSAEGVYALDDKKRPLNPWGRTGISSRGLLGRWGPNHAADPVVTRWKRDAQGKLVKDSAGNKILQFVAVKRSDNGQWALPGGMVDPGEIASVTVKREFGEEALAAMELSAEEQKKALALLEELFSEEHAIELYKGYVDDPRNTDNAWMETTAYNFHDEEGTIFSKFKLQGGDDATAAVWTDYIPGMELYASHTHFMELAYKKHASG